MLDVLRRGVVQVRVRQAGEKPQAEVRLVVGGQPVADLPWVE